MHVTEHLEDLTSLQLTTGLMQVPSIGPRHAPAFAALGLRCVADLLLHLPARYEQVEAEQPIGDLEQLVGTADRSEVHATARGEVVKVKRGFGRKGRIEVTVEDETGTLELAFFNQPWMQRRLHPGQWLRVVGPVRRHRASLQMANPRWEAIDPDAPVATGQSTLRAVYPAGEGVSSMAIARGIEPILDDATALLDDHLPEAYRREKNFPSLAEAYRIMHRPDDQEAVAFARRRLAFDELFMLQLAVKMKRYQRIRTQRAPALPLDAQLHERIMARIPFTLTEAQQQVVDEISHDVMQPIPMNRLLQGDVGAGKTVVALYAMLMAVAADHQAVLVAPTELLAEQHVESIGRMLSDSKVRVELLTGSLTASDRRGLLARLQAGEIDILVGTHAVLSEDVVFNSLAVAIIDEQHRFGVHQRAVLRRGEGDEIPHQLVMTANTHSKNAGHYLLRRS